MDQTKIGKRAEKRLNELDNLIAKIYEDHLREIITEDYWAILPTRTGCMD